MTKLTQEFNSADYLGASLRFVVADTRSGFTGAVKKDFAMIEERAAADPKVAAYVARTKASHAFSQTAVPAHRF